MDGFLTRLNIVGPRMASKLDQSKTSSPKMKNMSLPLTYPKQTLIPLLLQIQNDGCNMTWPLKDSFPVESIVRYTETCSM